MDELLSQENKDHLARKKLTTGKICQGVLLFKRKKCQGSFKTSISCILKIELFHLFFDFLLLKEIQSILSSFSYILSLKHSNPKYWKMF